jgi:ABC-2 type transport system permease protein
MPLGKLDLLLGYALAFGAVAVAQALLVSTLSLTVFGLDVAGPAWLLVVVALVDALLGMALGLFVSAFAATEFQAVQFMPALVLPQFLLCGLLVPRDEMPAVLHGISSALPLSYAVDALRDVTTNAEVATSTWGDLGVVVGAVLLALGLGAATLRRRTA